MGFRLAWLGAAVATLASFCAITPLACSSSDDSSDGTTDASADGSTGSDGAVLTEGGAPRSFRLASGGVQLLISGPAVGLQITPANLQTDVDVVEIHQEFYGVPWDSFKNATPVPAAWDSQMKSLAASALAMNKPVFLSITMLNGNRTSLAAKTTASSTDGSLTTTDNWAAPCYDFATAADAPQMKAAYLAYVDYMMATFTPTYLNFAVEVNLFFENCPDATAGVIDVANAAYDEAKSKKSDVIAFPSIQIDHLYGYTDACNVDDDAGTTRDTCFDANYAQISTLKRDRFAMSSYPRLGAITKPSDLPADWFTRAASKKSETPLIAETGWNSSSLVADLNGACDTVFNNTESDEEAYLDFVLRSADTQHIDLVNWWSDRDLVVATFMTDCPCTFDPTWCSVLDQFRGPDAGPDGGVQQFYGEILAKAFGTMGLRAYDGTQKPTVYARWQAALARPLSK